MADNLVQAIKDKIIEGSTLLDYLDKASSLDGCSKLARKVKAEMKFLTRLKQRPSLQVDHLRSSNIDNLAAICGALRQSEQPVAVLKVFRTASDAVPLVVDIVDMGGARWCKVVSRNPRALHRVSAGEGEFGERSVLDQAERYRHCAADNLHFFRSPRVRFVFSAGVGRSVCDQLVSRGVDVVGHVIDDCQLGVVPVADVDSGTDTEPWEEEEQGPTVDRCDTVCSEIPVVVTQPPPPLPSSYSPSIDMLPPLSADNALNMDVTTLLAYVSNLTNGFSGCCFPSSPLLQQQAAWERQSPVGTALRRIFANRTLVCCRAAADAFAAIVATVGGDHERRRAVALMRRVLVLDDVEPPFRLRRQRAPATTAADSATATAADSATVTAADAATATAADSASAAAAGASRLRQTECESSGHARSALIFGLGERLRLPTVTANMGFVRAAANQRVRLTVIEHGSRALSERKQMAATGNDGQQDEALTTCSALSSLCLQDQPDLGGGNCDDGNDDESGSTEK